MFSYDLLTRPRTAAWIGKSVDSVRRMERSEANPDGPFEALKIGRDVRITARSVLSYLEASSPKGSSGAAPLLSVPYPIRPPELASAGTDRP